MPSVKLEPVNLGSIARGAAMELFNIEIERVAANINDKATSATAVREITLKFKFKPDSERRAVEVSTSAVSKTAPVSEHYSRAFLGKDQDGKAYVFDQDPRQELLFQPPDKTQDNVLNFTAS